MADKKNYTEKDALEAWEGNDLKGAFEIVETKTADGKPDQLHLLNSSNGSIVAAVDGTGSDAYRRLAENPRATKLDNAHPPVSAVEDGESRYTSEGVLATPTQPEALKTFEGFGDIYPSGDNPPAVEEPKDEAPKKGK